MELAMHQLSSSRRLLVSHPACATRQPRGCVLASRATPDSKETGISEDVLARLKAAEDEAAKLRKQLEIAQAAKGAPVVNVLEGKVPRIDSTDSRETLFTSRGGKKTAWLNEADVEFFVGNSVGETSSAADDPEAAAVVQKRLIIGLGLAAAAGALALVPTEALRPKPSKPLFLYVVPLLRIQGLLKDCEEVVEDGQWDQLRTVLDRIQGNPNNVRDNLDNVVALLPDSSARSNAQKLEFDIIEYLDSMDYNKYFDAMPRRTISGVQNAEFVKFSRSALKAAQSSLAKLLDLVPRESLDAANDLLKMYNN
ncbi:hypothetical protein QJQ45_025536 [Haematococcus lacustris]|nr:hypothetical protein QJQ45_025536 [Haematococcus lacustris]